MYNKALFEIFGRGVYPYGICIGLGLIACILVLYYFTKKKGMPECLQDFIFIVAIVAVALGFLSAKLFQAFYDYLARGEWDFAGAGITVMGGLIGGAAAFLLAYFLGGRFYFRGNKKGLHIREFNTLLLVAPICITIAHAFGRVGCLMAGCCHGKYLGKNYVSGGIKMHPNGEPSGYYVPTQLYEALFLFALFGVLTYLYFHRCNILLHIYLIAYGVWRFIIEFFRTDYVGGSAEAFFRPSQVTSFVFIGIGVALLIIYRILKIPYILREEQNK